MEGANPSWRINTNRGVKMKSLEAALIEYFTEEIKKNPELKMKYDPARIGECRYYLMQEAEKHLAHSAGVIEASTVYRWAREFFLSEKWDKSEKLIIEPIVQKKEKKKAVKKQNEGQLTLF